MKWPTMVKGDWRLTVSVVVGLCALVLWLKGLLSSPLVQPHLLEQRSYVEKYDQENSPDLQRARLLAVAYWSRYRDIREDPDFGENGTMGIFGPKAHYRQHGRREGRIWALIPVGEEPAIEQQLAEHYWQRYPEIAESEVWGRSSRLGVRGPRDHYTYVGSKEKRRWGADSPR